MRMQAIQSPQELHNITEEWRKNESAKIALIPTMGALHEGHLSLIDIAREKATRVVVSIFVNPAQFAPHEDFDSYPRTIEADLKKLEKRGVDLVYLPQESDIYPDGMNSDIKAGSAANGLETDFRAHFFDGVVNIVHRLFTQIRPDIAVFGKKDYQQLCVIREMVQTQNMNIEIIGGEIIRDAHGLALSSRNAYLSGSELDTARMLNIILFNASQNRDCDSAKALISQAGFDKIDYVSIRGNRILAAVWIGKTRLIDNMAIS